MRKQMLFGAGLVLAAALILGLVKYFQISAAMAAAQHGMPPVAVTTAVAEQQEWPRTVSAVGSLIASQGATLAAESAGRVSRVLFESGDRVEAGKVLVELDSAVEEAQLRGAEALLDAAKRRFERARELRKSNANSRADFESAEAAYLEASAAVESFRASVARRRIVAPFSGRAGIRAVNLGQYVAPGDRIVPLYVMDPLYLNFNLPQESVSEVRQGLKVRLTVDAYPGESFEGTVSAVNPQIERTTRNLEIQATVPNADERLRPGMFAKVELILAGLNKVIAIPGSSVSFAPYGDTVFIVEKMQGPDGAEYEGVRQQVVTLGERRGDLIAIDSGLKAGEVVVSAGTFRLRQGAAVLVNNSVAPSAEVNPNPADT